MRKAIARKMLQKFADRYGYDTTYMSTMLEHAPDAFFKFGKILPVSRHRSVVPKNAYYAVKIVAAMAEDCGPCSQLAVDMGKEAGVERAQIEAVLEANELAMAEDTQVGYRFAQAVVARSESLDSEHAAREAVRERWGVAGIVELSLCLAIGRVFPMTKNAMGYGKECRRVVVDQDPLEVRRRAS